MLLHYGLYLQGTEVYDFEESPEKEKWPATWGIEIATKTWILIMLGCVLEHKIPNANVPLTITFKFFGIVKW